MPIHPLHAGWTWLDSMRFALCALVARTHSTTDGGGRGICQSEDECKNKQTNQQVCAIESCLLVRSATRNRQAIIERMVVVRHHLLFYQQAGRGERASDEAKA